MRLSAKEWLEKREEIKSFHIQRKLWLDNPESWGDNPLNFDIDNKAHEGIECFLEQTEPRTIEELRKEFETLYAKIYDLTREVGGYENEFTNTAWFSFLDFARHFGIVKE